MKSVDRLHGSRRIEERRVRQCSLGHVDKHPESVGNVFVQGAFQRRRQRVHGAIGVQVVRRTLDAHQWGTGGDELAKCGNHVKSALSIGRQLHEAVPVNAGEDP